MADCRVAAFGADSGRFASESLLFAVLIATTSNSKYSDRSTGGLGQQLLEVPHNLRDALLFLQDAGGELRGRQVGDVFLGARVLAAKVAAVGEQFGGLPPSGDVRDQSPRSLPRFEAGNPLPILDGVYRPALPLLRFERLFVAGERGSSEWRSVKAARFCEAASSAFTTLPDTARRKRLAEGVFGQ